MNRLNDDPARDLAIARAALAAARAVPGVAAIGPGREGIARVYGPDGASECGVTLRDTGAGFAVELHLIVETVPFVPMLAAVRTSIADAMRRLGAPPASIDIFIDGLIDAQPRAAA